MKYVIKLAGGLATTLVVVALASFPLVVPADPNNACLSYYDAADYSAADTECASDFAATGVAMDSTSLNSDDSQLDYLSLAIRAAMDSEAQALSEYHLRPAYSALHIKWLHRRAATLIDACVKFARERSIVSAGVYSSTVHIADGIHAMDDTL